MFAQRMKLLVKEMANHPKIVRQSFLLLLQLLLLLQEHAQGADISLEAICGNKLVGQTVTFCFFLFLLRWLGGLLSEEDLFESDRRDFFLCRKGALERARGTRHQHQQGCG